MKNDERRNDSGTFINCVSDNCLCFSNIKKLRGCNYDKEIAISLGRIADMLTEANGYIVEYDSENEGDITESEKKE